MNDVQTTPKQVAPLTKEELALIQNDLSKLSPHERLTLYNKTCESLGLNPLTQPFGFIEFRGGKLSFYAKKDCTDQLRKIHGVSLDIASKETISDVFTVCVKAKDKSGRHDEDMGAVPTKGLVGDALANAMMKCLTKAKRRVTLSICGLGILDESEIETIKDARIVDGTETVKQKDISNDLNWGGFEGTDSEFESLNDELNCKTKEPDQKIQQKPAHVAHKSVNPIPILTKEYLIPGNVGLGGFKGHDPTKLSIQDLNKIKNRLNEYAVSEAKLTYSQIVCYDIIQAEIDKRTLKL